MHRLLFARQAQLAQADLTAWAGELGLNVREFERDLADPELQQLIEADLKVAKRFGARGTPSAFINGRRVVGARPVGFYSKMIAEERQVAVRFAAARRPSGVTLYEAMSAEWTSPGSEPKPSATTH